MIAIAAFADVFAVLAKRLRADVDELDIRVYYDALCDLEPELLQAAADRLGSTVVDVDGKAWFPKAPEWRSTARQIEQEWLDLQRARLRGLPAPLCRGCYDTGFVRDEQTNTVTPCECRHLRREELLGRRPLPALPPPSDVQPLSRDDAATLRRELELRLRKPITIKPMPHATRARLDHNTRRANLREAIASIAAALTRKRPTKTGDEP
jgi:hypothetical protein